MMTVQLSVTVPPKKAGSRKYIQKMTIRSGMPRITLINAKGRIADYRLWEILRSPRIRPPKKERTQATTAR